MDKKYSKIRKADKAIGQGRAPDPGKNKKSKKLIPRVTKSSN